MTAFDHDFLRSPSEPEFRLETPELDHATTFEVVREQLDFKELFGAVALFSVNHHGHFDIPERKAA